MVEAGSPLAMRGAGALVPSPKLTKPLTKFTLTLDSNVFKIARAIHSFLNTQMRLQWNSLISSTTSKKTLVLRRRFVGNE